MHRVRRGFLIAGILTAILLSSQPIHAQFTANFQTNIISGVTSNWIGDYYVGSNRSQSVLLIQDTGVLSNGYGVLGYESFSTNNRAVVTGTGSVWNNSPGLLIGWGGSGNSLVISDSGQVVSAWAVLGANSTSKRNSALVTGEGSVWFSGNLTVGEGGNSNSLTIINGGTVYSGGANIGDLSKTNSVEVIDSGSLWDITYQLTIGQGIRNSLVISNGGQVITRGGTCSIISDSNTVLVTDGGRLLNSYNFTMIHNFNSIVISNCAQVINLAGAIIGTSNSVKVADSGVWSNTTLEVHGSGSSLHVDGGSVFATNVVLGLASTFCNSLALLNLDSGNIVVTNSTSDDTFEVGQGKLILNGGTLLVDRFVMTNACAQFVRTGGTLIYGTAVLDPNRDDDGDGMPNVWEQNHGFDPLNANDANMDIDGDGMSNLQELLAGTDPQDNASAFRIIGITSEGDDLRVTWTMGSGKTNALQSSAGDSGFYNNGFVDVFTVTNTIGPVTNYLDAGAATNGLGRFYRVRLVP